jgi:hypothetical protein
MRILTRTLAGQRIAGAVASTHGWVRFLCSSGSRFLDLSHLFARETRGVPISLSRTPPPLSPPPLHHLVQFRAEHLLWFRHSDEDMTFDGFIKFGRKDKRTRLAGRASQVSPDSGRLAMTSISEKNLLLEQIHTTHAFAPLHIRGPRWSGRSVAAFCYHYLPLWYRRNGDQSRQYCASPLIVKRALTRSRRAPARSAPVFVDPAPAPLTTPRHEEREARSSPRLRQRH